MIDTKELVKRGDQLHSNRSSLLSLWQEIADNFCPWRGEFTYSRSLGDEYASHLYSSYPLIVQRELSGAVASMLRPKTKVWFHQTVEDEERLGKAARMWLEEKTKVQRKAMYDRQAQFTRATKEGDDDFTAFGQCVIQREIDWDRPGLLYRTWHLRDVAWAERYDGTISEIHRNWSPTLNQLIEKFGEDKLHPDLLKNKDKEGFRKVACRAIVVPTTLFTDKASRKPWTMAYIDRENDHLIESSELLSHGYTIPRWKHAGSQYAISPATMIALPDARLIQAMTLTLLEAGEMAVRPPMVATTEAIRSDVQLYAGGITWADVEYDERKGDVLRPISQDLRGLPFGLDVQEGIREMLATAFYLNKINMPMRDKDMTAYEASKLYEQYIRDAIPLFEPMEIEYNGALCDDTFQVLFRIGAFGPYDEVPEELRGADIQFKFESPLHDAIEQEKGERLRIAIDMALQTAQIDATAPVTVDAITALRDALGGIGSPEAWIRDEQEFKRIVESQQEQRKAEEALALAEQAGNAQQAMGQ